MEKTLGKRIVENRKRLGLTQEQLAERLGVTPQAISKWENDQSCPDIALLPKLAEVFGTSTDELLGHEKANNGTNVVHTGEIVDEDSEDAKDSWEFRWGNSRRGAVGFAVYVLSVGVLYMLTQIFHWTISLWEIIWTTGIMMVGLWGILKEFSFFSMGCLLFGGYSLVTRIVPLPPIINGKGIWAILIVIFGLSLLADALKKPRKPVFHIHKSGGSKSGKKVSTYDCNGDTFTYNGSFTGAEQNVDMAFLRTGEINVSFGECTVDLSNVEMVADDCEIDVNCSFGEVEIEIPSKYRATVASNEFFGHVDVEGTPDEVNLGSINITGNVSFGHITIQYV